MDDFARNLSIKSVWELFRWSAEAGKVIGSNEEAKALNQFLDILQVKVQEARRSLIEDNIPITAEALQQVLTGKNKARRMLLEMFQHHN